MSKKIIIIFILSIIKLTSSAFGYNDFNNNEIIGFEEYKIKLKDVINNNTSKDSKTVEKNFNKIKNKACSYEEEGDDYHIIDAICIRNNNYPRLSFKKAVDTIRDHVDKFENLYNLKSQQFYYEGAKLIENTGDLNMYKQYDGSIEQKQVLTYLSQNNIRIKIHNKYLAKNTVKDFSFFVIKKSLGGIGDCSLTNYKVGIGAVNGLYLNPGDIFNMNKAVAYLPGYCTGSGRKGLMFYGGICGASGQLFRAALLTPGVKTLKRYPHSKRRVRYYDQYIFGDDAAISEMDKQLEIQNTNSLPVYFKLLDKGDYNYFVAILPSKQENGVFISKVETGPRSAELSKTTYKKDTYEIIDYEVFPSKYYQVYNGEV